MDQLRLTRIGVTVGIVVMTLAGAMGQLRAEPQDRMVAEWAILLGGSVRIAGDVERVG